MPSTRSKLPRRDRRHSDHDFVENEGALRSAQVALASLAATDEEFAAGIPLSDPGSVISGSRSAPEGETDKPPKRQSKKSKVISPYAQIAAEQQQGIAPKKLDKAKLKARIKRVVTLEKNAVLLKSKPAKKR